ncbi:MAG: sporulation protein YqfD [Clostridia bacterium]|nr:sporulation protein YqfD [Clostridia bacterium]
MLKKIYAFFTGYRRLSCPKKTFANIVPTMARYSIRYDHASEKDGRVSFTVSELGYKKLIRQIDESVFRVHKRKGLPYFLYRYRRRYGLMVGIAIFLILTKMSSAYVWDVSVDGNESISDSEVINTLDKLGFSVGSHIPDIDFYDICHRFILENENVAWISVNMEGTSARVKLIERDAKGENDNGSPSNIVASSDGIIIRTETVDGEVCVKAGDSVTEGQLLISGVVEIGQGIDTGRFMLTRAKGSVYALTKRSFSVSVPLNGVKTAVTDKVLAKKTLIFFGKSIKLKENSSILGKECDIIKESKRVVLFEGLNGSWHIPLPVTVVTEYALVTEQVEFSYTEDDALKIAEKEMSLLYASTMEGAELVNKTVESVIEDGVLKLTWEVECIIDIGKETPIGLV